MKNFFLWGFIILVTAVILGLNIGAKNFNREMGQSAAVVFAWEQTTDIENGLIKYKGVILGQEFYVLQSTIDEFKERFQRSYEYWKDKVNLIRVES